MHFIYYSLINSRKDLTMLDIEQSFASNICRCTGYRPILEAFKQFAKDAPTSSEMPDIEELRLCKKNTVCAKKCNDRVWCYLTKEDAVAKSKIEKTLKDGKMWYCVEKVSDIFEILELEGDDSYMLVAGNTAKGKITMILYSSSC